MKRTALHILTAGMACLLLSASAATAQSAGLAFLKLETSAEALAVGSALSASSRDAFSTFINPAGLGGSAMNSVGLTYVSWVSDVNILNLASRFQLGRNTGVGLALTSTTAGDFEAREGPGDPTGTFSAQFTSIGVGIGHEFRVVRLGVTGKYISEDIFTYSARGFAFDLGFQANILPDLLWIGATVQHLGDINELNVEASDLPTTYRGGIALHPVTIRTFDDDAEALRIFFSADVVHRPDEIDDTVFHLGFWATAFEFLSFRLGYLSDNALRNYTVGIGLQYKSFGFDYGYLPFEEGFGTSGQVVTLTYNW